LNWITGYLRRTLLRNSGFFLTMTHPDFQLENSLRRYMTDSTKIQTKVCEDAITRMAQAKERNNENDFLLEKGKLLDALEAIKTADPDTYAKYIKFGDAQFNAD
jgi:hypothetical protein